MSEPAQSIRQARAARARLLRRRVATGAVMLFVGAWALIATELVTGHDPALAAHQSSSSSSSGISATTPTSSSGSAGSTSSTGSTSPSASVGASSSDGSTGSTSLSTAPSSVTTQQS
jgi:hypothetical protein